MLGLLSVDSEQIMSKDKYPNTFSLQMDQGYCVYYPLNLFCNTRSSENWGTFAHVRHLDQSRTRENI